jgi:hypothetical protein
MNEDLAPLPPGTPAPATDQRIKPMTRTRRNDSPPASGAEDGATTTSPERQSADFDPASPLHDRYPGADRPDQVPTDDATWPRVRVSQRVLGSDGQPLGRVTTKSHHVFEVEVPEGLLRTRELYVPHMAISRVEDDTVHLGWRRQELIDNYEHYRRYHYGHPAQS